LTANVSCKIGKDGHAPADFLVWLAGFAPVVVWLKARSIPVTMLNVEIITLLSLRQIQKSDKKYHR
jgi:hypothetical protein